jgi:hypothetical protein
MRACLGLMIAGWLSVGPVLAAERMAFAAAQSPEQAFEVCHAATAETAAACAMKKCKASGGSDCVVMAACLSGWSGTMGVRLEEVHFTDSLCGAPSKAAAIASLKAFCKGHLPYVKECYLASVYSPMGQEEKIEKTLDPRKLK